MIVLHSPALSGSIGTPRHKGRFFAQRLRLLNNLLNGQPGEDFCQKQNGFDTLEVLGR